MKCLIENCGHEATDLNQHITKTHGMTKDEYKLKFNVKYLIDEEVRMKRGLSRKNNQERKKFICHIESCTNKFHSTEGELIKHFRGSKDVEHNHVLYNEKNKDKWIECKICGFRKAKIFDHVLKEHGMQTEEYEKYFGQGSLINPNYLEKIRENGKTATLFVDQRVYGPHKCKLCDNIIDGKKVICSKCKIKNARKEQEEKFKDLEENNHFVRCQCKHEDGTFCGWPDTRIFSHIKMHNYSIHQYRQEFRGKLLIAPALQIKQMFVGPHTEETKLKIAEAHLGIEPWNKGLTQDDHPSLESISEKAKTRVGQLQNNQFHLLAGKIKHKEKKSWANGLTNETSELLENINERGSGLFNHNSYFGFEPMFDLNKNMEDFREEQKEKIRIADGKCLECQSIENLITHHIIQGSYFHPHDFNAHSFTNLITLCTNCHSSIARKVDFAFTNSKGNLEFMKISFSDEYLKFIEWKDYASKRIVKIIPFEKKRLERLDVKVRSTFEDMLFDELRNEGFPKIEYSDQVLAKDYKNLTDCNFQYNYVNDLTTELTSGNKIIDHFIKQQFSKLEIIYQDDVKLRNVIRDLLGISKENNEPWNLTNKNVINCFRNLNISYAFSRYKTVIAKWIIQQFCDSDTVYDYAAGWGSRMLAAASVGKNYIGVDTNTKLVDELRVLAEWLENKNRGIKIKLENTDAKDFDPGLIKFAYSCPPYGVLEKYENMPFENNIEWFEYYMKPVIHKCYNSLEKDGKFVCHINTKLEKIIQGELIKTGFHEFRIIPVENRVNKYDKTGTKMKNNETILIYEK